MATVVDYPSMVQAVQDWFARADLTGPGPVDYFIQSAEDRLYDDIIARNMGRGTKDFEASLSGAIANGVFAVPAGYVAMKHLLLDNGGSTMELTRRSAEQIYTLFPTRQATGIPSDYARDGSNFVFGPYPDSDYALSGTYWQRAARLSAANPTSWMVLQTPALFSAAVFAAAAGYLKDSESVQYWEGQYGQKLASYILRSSLEEVSGSSLAMTPG